jgi:hypothetical protein
MRLRHFKKRISLILPKAGRTLKRNILQMHPKMTREEREISAMIRNLLSNPENRVFYSLGERSIRIQTKDKKYVVSLNSNHIRINFVTVTLNERIGTVLVERVIERIESDIREMDRYVMMDQKEFITGMNGVFIKNNMEFTKRSKLVKNASSRNIESTLSRILHDSMNE